MLTKEIITERLSSKIYHYTHIGAAAKILASGKFQLSSSFGGIEHSYSPKGYPYFLSTTRSLSGGYHDSVHNAAVMFNLDGDYYSRHYPGHAVDYWQNRHPKYAPHGSSSEAEDRIFSKSPDISIDGVTAIHVFMHQTRTDDSSRYLTRSVMLNAKKRGIPAYLYTDETAWRYQQISKSVPISDIDLSSKGYKPRSYTSMTDYVKPWLELLFQTDKAKLSKRATKRLQALQWYNDSSSHEGLETDLFNARKPSSGASRESAIKLIDFMRKNKLDAKGVVDYIRNRWDFE